MISMETSKDLLQDWSTTQHTLSSNVIHALKRSLLVYGELKCWDVVVINPFLIYSEISLEVLNDKFYIDY